MSDSRWLTYEDAEAAASAHRDQFGDDVIQHDPEEYGNTLLCPDCDWGVSFFEPCDNCGDQAVCPECVGT